MSMDDIKCLMSIYHAGQSAIAEETSRPEEKRYPYDKEQEGFLCGPDDRVIADLMFMSMEKAVTMNEIFMERKTRVQHQKDQ